ncbi:MAG: LPP20 family lipoprotein [bacterium]|nr:LPP20 family lipoprotein [bacterium]
MKKKMISLSILAIAVVFSAGCGTTKAVTKQTDTQQDTTVQSEFKDAPKWVTTSQVEGGIAAVGIAKVGKAGMSFARTEALANGRNELARMMELKVKNMVKSFMNVTGVGNGEMVDRVSADVSKQVASQTLNGTTLRDSWASPKDNLYVLIVIDNELAKKSIKDQVETSFKNEQALWQEFKAKNGQDELDKEVNKLVESKK